MSTTPTREQIEALIARWREEASDRRAGGECDRADGIIDCLLALEAAITPPAPAGDTLDGEAGKEALLRVNY